MQAARYRDKSDLPTSLAIFPLPGALLFPRWQLPLNIFEPRYLNMVDDAMTGTRMIGMIQPQSDAAHAPLLFDVGCAGRITSYSETGDGRYLISLTGICRFNIREERSSTTPYRQVTPDWDSFITDLHPTTSQALPSRERLMQVLQAYVARNDLDADWSAVENAPLETLVSALCTGCPFSVMEKQALLEATTLKERAETLISLLSMDMPGGETGTMN